MFNQNVRDCLQKVTPKVGKAETATDVAFINNLMKKIKKASANVFFAQLPLWGVLWNKALKTGVIRIDLLIHRFQKNKGGLENLQAWIYIMRSRSIRN